MRERTLEIDFEKRLEKEGISPQKGLKKNRLQTIAFILAALAFGFVAVASRYISNHDTPGSSFAVSGNAANQVAVIQQAVSQLYSGQPGFSGLDVDTLIGSGTIPQGMIFGTTIRHSFGGRIEVNADDSGEGFDVIFNSVPSLACPNMVSHSTGSNSMLSVSVETDNGVERSDLKPFEFKDAVKACGAQGKMVKIIWQFR